MAYDVFISYAVEDKEVADKVCRALEEQDIKCWYAPRDVPYGADYEEAIVDAISASQLLILILSSHSNESPHVKREIQNACAEGSTTHIIPLRIEDITYNKALRYYLGSAQWLDASTPPLENHLQRLVEHVRARLPQTRADAAAGAGSEARPQASVETRSQAGVEARQVAYKKRSGGVFADTRHYFEEPALDKRRKPFPIKWLAVVVGVLLAVVVAVVAYRSSGGGNVNTNSSNLATPAANSNANAQGSATPTHQRTPTPTPSPTPTPTVPLRPAPIRNFNFNIRRPTNRNN
jgi:hypothetical protein